MDKMVSATHCSGFFSFRAAVSVLRQHGEGSERVAKKCRENWRLAPAGGRPGFWLGSTTICAVSMLTTVRRGAGSAR